MFEKLRRELEKTRINSSDKRLNLSDDIVTWTKQVRKLEGQPFSFENREYLLPIYRDPSKEIYIVKSRQMEITEFALNWLLFLLTKNPNTVGLYTTDRKDHVSAFSKLRLHQRGIDQSEKLQKLIILGQGNESWQPFLNGSNLFMYSAWGDFESARSFPVDFAVIDEAQSIDAGKIPVLKETMAKSRFGRLLVIGTGSEEGDDWWKLWHMGDQKEWDLQSKSWVAKKLENFNHASSYHVTQHMASSLAAEKIEQKRKEYSPRLYANEVEGLWYKGTRKPLVPSEIEFLFDRNISLLSPDEVDHNFGHLFLGVDWGGGEKAFTIPWIWQCLDMATPRFRLIYVSKINERSTEKQADMIAELVDQYKIEQGVMDAGGGTRQVEKLSNRYAHRMIKCSYMVRPEDPVEYVYPENRIAVDRTWAIETIIDLITRPETNTAIPNGVPRIFIPAKEIQKIQWLVDNFTCIEAESVDLQSGKKYTRFIHPSECPDDALHACVYAYLAYLIRSRRKKLTIAVGTLGGG